MSHLLKEKSKIEITYKPRVTYEHFPFEKRKRPPIEDSQTTQTNSQIQRMRELVFFETSVDKNSVFVQEQILYSVKLFYSESIRGDFPTPPSLQNTIVENVEEEKRYESIINRKRYYVLEKKYALFPQSIMYQK